MKTIFIILFTLLLISCGKNTEFVSVGNSVEVIKAQDFEGVYYFDHGGYMELIAGDDGEVTIMREGQNLQSINPDNDTLGSHPIMYATGLEPQSGEIKLFVNLRYTDGNDLEEDLSGANIRDTRRTDVIIKLLDNRRIQMTIKVYSDSMNNNTNSVVAERVFTSI